MAKKSYFGNRISPSCSYCLFGNRSREGNKVLCEKQGLVDADYSCKKWVYDPIKRVPKKQLNIPNQEDIKYAVHFLVYGFYIAKNPQSVLFRPADLSILYPYIFFIFV